MSSLSVSRRSLITFFRKSENSQATNTSSENPTESQNDHRIEAKQGTIGSLLSNQTRRKFLQTTGTSVAVPFLPGGVVTTAQEGVKYIAAVSNNPLINTALNMCGINFGTLTNNLSVGASLLSNATSPLQASLVSSSLGNLLHDGSSSIDPDAVKSLCYFFNPSQEVHDSIPMSESGAEQRYEDGMRKSYEQSRVNRENFRNDPGVLDFICSGNYYPGELEHTPPEELADLFFDDLKRDFSGVYQAFIEVSRAADVTLRNFSKTQVVREASQGINRVCKGFKRPNGVRSTHTSQNPHIDSRINRMTQEEMDKFDLRKKATVEEPKEVKREEASPSYALSLIYHFPALEELKRVLESIPNPK